MSEALSSAIRWSSVSTLSRAGLQLVFALLIARIIGPINFGIAAQAMVYINLIGNLIDQGFSTALIQRHQVDRQLCGAVVSVGCGVAAVLAALTIALAPQWASFMRTPELKTVLIVLSATLLIRSVALVPKAMLTRGFDFRKLAIMDTAAVISGGVLGLAVAGVGGGYWAVVVLTVASDAAGGLVLLAIGVFYAPNLHLRRLREIIGYSWRAFASGLLMNSLARNLDNLLIGRYQGPAALSFYGLAYRTLMIPIQLAGTTVSSVLLPVFTRLAHNLTASAAELARVTRAQATIWLPLMALISAAGPQLILVLFGPQWTPAIPIVQVLAIAGALQAIYQPSIQLLLGIGRADLCLRLSWLITIVSAIGIVSGLPFGPLGVAVGYSVATLLLVPLHWLIRRHTLGATFRSQMAQLVPGCHVALWVVATYISIALTIPGKELLVLVCGGGLATLTGAAVLRLAHRSSFVELEQLTRRVVGRGHPGEQTQTDI